MDKELTERDRWRKKRREELAAGELLIEGRELQKLEVGPEQFYQTAIKVQKPRDIEKVKRACLYEAEIAGDLFYYQWQVTTKGGQKRQVDGVSINGAMAIARNFGNCAVPVSVEREVDGADLFKAAFVDLETGFTVPRYFRAHYVQPPKKFAEDPDQRARWHDMQFQKAQSQAQRNVILKGVPYWLVDMVKKAAKGSAYENIRKMGLAKAKEKALKIFSEEHGVDQAALEKHLGKKDVKWTVQDVVGLRSILRAFEEGFDSPETLFGVGPVGEEDWLSPEAIKELVDEFWSDLKKRGIKANDPEIVEYVKGVASFAQVPIENYIADLVAAFSDPDEIDRFLEQFETKKKRGDINPPKGQAELFDENAQE